MTIKNTQNRKKIKNNNTVNISYSKNLSFVKNNILGVGVTNATKEEILEYILENMQNAHKKFFIVTPNPEILVYAQSHEEFRNTLNMAEIALCDGIGVLLAGKLLGKPFKERIIGTNFVETICENIVDKPITVGFLGGRLGVAEATAECLARKYPGLKIAFAGQEWQKQNDKGLRIKDKNPEKKIYHSSLIIHHSIDILFVAFGFPKQEEWMAQNLDKLPVKVMMGVGGAFDQITRPTLRPPVVVHTLGLGWLYRLIKEPSRIKRQLALVTFIWLVLKEKLKLSS